MAAKDKDRFYDFFFFIYPLVNFFFSRQKRVLINEVKQLKPGKLLDIGTGKGELLPDFAVLHQVTGIDISTKMVQHASQYTSEKIRVERMDGQFLSFDEESFDYIVFSHTVATTKLPEILLNEASRVLKPYGKVLILNHFTPHNIMLPIDKAFSYISSIFHFQSYFKPENLNTPAGLELIKEINLGRLNYYKLLIFEKL